jgi:hypothetical protein
VSLKLHAENSQACIHCIPLHDIPPGLQIVGAPIPVLGPTATLSGRVTDPSGAIIAGVKVEATNVETNILFSGRDEC